VLQFRRREEQRQAGSGERARELEQVVEGTLKLLLEMSTYLRKHIL
jgi:hypothetical protein